MKKVVRVLLIISGITLILVALSVRAFPEWLTIPGGLLVLLGVAFNAVLDAGSKIKDWVDLVSVKEKNDSGPKTQANYGEIKQQGGPNIIAANIDHLEVYDSPHPVNSQPEINNPASKQIKEVVLTEQPVKTQPFALISNLRVKRRHHVSATLPNGDVLIAGGLNDDNSPPPEILASVELFSFGNMTVSSHGRMLVRRYFAAATFLPNNTVLVTGGKGENGESLDSAEVYNPLTRSFTFVSPMTMKRHGHTSILLRNGKVLILGGAGDNYPTEYRLNSAEIFDPISNTFSLTGGMSEARLTEHVPIAVPLRDGRVLVAGGFGLNEELASVEIYDPYEGIFTPFGNMAVKRSCHTLTLLQNDKVLVAGGYADNSGHLFTAEIYDPETGTSSLTDNMKVPHFLHTATLLPDGKVLIIGGYSPLAEIYDPNTNSFSAFGELATGRTLHTTSLLPNGQLLIIGGANDKGNSQATIEQSNISYPALLDIGRGLTPAPADSGSAAHDCGGLPEMTDN